MFFIFRVKFIRNLKIILILFIPFIGLLLKFLIPVSKELLIPNICRQMKYLKSFSFFSPTKESHFLGQPAVPF